MTLTGWRLPAPVATIVEIHAWLCGAASPATTSGVSASVVFSQHGKEPPRIRRIAFSASSGVAMHIRLASSAPVDTVSNQSGIRSMAYSASQCVATHRNLGLTLTPGLASKMASYIRLPTLTHGMDTVSPGPAIACQCYLRAPSHVWAPCLGATSGHEDLYIWPHVCPTRHSRYGPVQMIIGGRAVLCTRG